MHGTVLVVDVADFGGPHRTNRHQVNVRRDLYLVLSRALTETGVPWGECRHEDRGDGILVLLPERTSKSLLVEALPQRLRTLLREHNDGHPVEEQIRLRLALHAGEIYYDDHGVAGRAVNLTFRLVDSAVFREAFADSAADLAVITSSWFYEEVVWHCEVTGYWSVSVDNKETSTTAWIWMPDSNAARVMPAAALRQLPTDARQFVGREAELDQLMGLLYASKAGTVVIAAIDGSPGIGKTSLALHWAHSVKDRFPDGQLHVNLRGFDQREPMDAGQALHDFLQSLGIAPKSIPAELDAKAAMYRSALSDRRMLIVLDNARSSEHVRPLLPGNSSSVTVVTSRDRLDSLVIREGAHRLSLNALSTQDARALLAERAPGLDVDSAAAGELIKLCAWLPIALSVVAARAAEHSSMSSIELVRELREERTRLDVLDLGEVDISVRAVFSWSYNVLSTDAARLFRLLGLHPGPDIDTHACDRLLGKPSRACLTELTRAHLLTEHVPHRYRFHDLLRAYATELAEHGTENADAAKRVLDYYLDTALHADSVIQPCRDGVIRTPSPTSRISTYREAMDWFAAEEATLLAGISFAADCGLTGHVWHLAWACTSFFRRTGRFDDCVAIHSKAVEATRHTADREGFTTALCYLASSLARLDRFDEAIGHLQEAIKVVETVQNQDCRAAVHAIYTRVLEKQGRYAEALAHVEVTWAISRSNFDNPLRLADAFNIRGRLLYLLGQYSKALACCESALAYFRDLGNQDGEAHVLVTLGNIKRNLGHYDEAISCLQQSLDIDRQLDDVYWQGIVLKNIGETYLAACDLPRAREAFQEAVSILRVLHHPDAEVLRAKYLM
jgi:tetratricopeptide (TPR) repeat protein